MNSRREQVVLSTVSVVSIVLFFMFLHNKAPFMLTNDNYYLRSIASGEMLGKPEAHLYHMGIVSGFPISLLYRLFPYVSWFGAAICASVGAVLAVVLYKILQSCKRIWMQIAVYLIFFLAVYAFLGLHIWEPQYTTVTGIAGCGGVFLLFLYKPKEGNFFAKLLSCIPFLLFFVWSCGMRRKAFFMLLPFVGMIFVAHVLDYGRKILPAAAAFICVIAAVLGADRLAYISNEWREFRIYNDNREVIYDFNGFPDYDKYEEVYEELGIARSSYEAAAFHYNVLLDESINAEAMRRLAEISEQERIVNRPDFMTKIRQIAEEFFERQLLSYMDRPLNILVFFLYAFVFVTALAERKFRCLRDLAFVVIARMFDWIYLLYYGRDPARVTQIIYVAELVVLLGLIIKYDLAGAGRAMDDPDRAEKAKKNIKGMPILMDGKLFVLVIGVTALCFRFGIPKAEGVKGEVKSWETASETYREMMAYFSAHPDRIYFFDMNLLYYMEEAMEGNDPPVSNYVYMGSWMPHSPWYARKFEEWGIADPAEALIEDERVYLVYHVTEGSDYGFLSDYYEEHFPGSRIEVTETVNTYNDTEFLILKAVR